MRQPDFDIDRKIGEQSELWVSDLREALRGKAQVEVKAPKPFLRAQSFYVEYMCRGRDGVWRKSGVATSKAQLFMFTFGSLFGGLVIETQWLLRAARHAYRNPLKRKECTRGSNPTKAVVVDFTDLYATKEREP